MMEMDLKLTAVEYVVFDEADRYNVRKKIVLNSHKCVTTCTCIYSSMYRKRKNSTVSIECLPALEKQLLFAILFLHFLLTMQF